MVPTSTPQQAETFRERGGLWVVAQSALMLAVVALGVWCHGDWKPGFQLVLGTLLFITGGVVGIAGVAVLGNSRTPFPKPTPHARLVRHGIYALIRHPLYTSVVLASLGWALIWQSLPALGAAALLVPLFDAKARREERWLTEQFPQYADYQRHVRRFIPGIY
jgi:protein-S-isoprenylcysteine O-methyltransferase Ste14